MRHFHSREEYDDAVDALLDGTDPIVDDDAYVREIVAEDPIDADLLGDLANRTIVGWSGGVGLHTFGSVMPDYEIGWSPESIIEHSRTRTEDVCPDEYLSPSDAAYYLLVADLEDALAAREMEAR